MGLTAEKTLEIFALPAGKGTISSYGDGHINDTYRLVLETAEDTQVYIVQRMSRIAFPHPEELMENIVGVTGWLKEKITAAGGDPLRETLNLIPTRDGASFYIDEDGEYWRVYLFVKDTLSFSKVERPEDFYESAEAFGNFQRLLDGYPVEKLHETIARFHDTPNRYRALQKAAAADSAGRVKEVLPELEFIRQREAFIPILETLKANGGIPTRVTHNDTKLNNILFDRQTRKGICIIDLDTVMPGLAVNDFGDSIRFGANTGEEDEQDLTRVSLDLDLYELYARGFVRGSQGMLTDAEFSHLHTGAMMMTLECGIRFLADYLEGDHYFKIHRQGQNLDRCRSQLKLFEDMEKKSGQMIKIAESLKKGE